MSWDWCVFLTGLIASLIGALIGVLAAFRAERWWESRQKKREAGKLAKEVLEEIQRNNIVIKSLIGHLKLRRKGVKKRQLSSSDFAKPFGRLQAIAAKRALERDLVGYMCRKHTLESEVKLKLEWYPERCDAINILTHRFEDYITHFLLPLPEPGDAAGWQITEQYLLPRISDLLDQMKQFLDRSQDTQKLFEEATGLTV